MNGVIILNKPQGKTSHDMVSFIRRLTGIKKVGHTGTLDPDATGVLPICIGNATKAADMLTVSDKAYKAQMVLGMTTDTQDASGEILTEQPVTASAEDIKIEAEKFIGEITQIPPMFSAIKQDGRKLCDLARAGITVERKSRTVKIYGIKITEIDMENAAVTMEVECSKGTYIRTLCEDIGKSLGCGAYMNTLVRTKSAGFTLEQSHTTDELTELSKDGLLDTVLIPTDRLFEEYKQLKVNEKIASKVKNGMKIRAEGLKDGNLYRIYAESGEFLCISRFDKGVLTMEKSFWVQ